MTQLLFLQIDEEYLKDHKSRGKNNEHWELHSCVPCNLVLGRLGNMICSVIAIPIPAIRGYTHVEGNTLLIVKNPTKMEICNPRRKCSVVDEVSE